MNITLSVNQRLLKEARRAARSMGKSLNQLVREYFEQLTSRDDARRDLEEIRRLTEEGGGRSKGWRYARAELHERP